MKQLHRDLQNINKFQGLESIHETYGSLEDVIILTLAPELPGATEAIKGLSSLGIKVALGHSSASLAQSEEAVQSGANLITHLFNAMLPVSFKELRNYPLIAARCISSLRKATKSPMLKLSCLLRPLCVFLIKNYRCSFLRCFCIHI